MKIFIMNRFNGAQRPIIPAKPIIKDEDDWETDPDFVNDISERESRWGSKTVEGSGRLDTFDVSKLRDEVVVADEIIKQKQFEAMPKASEGYGGKFGVQKDRVDNCAVDFSYEGKVEAHVSQKDYKTGFGGKFGVQKDRQDKSAATWDEKIEVPKHESQKDYKHGFGGQFGIQKDRQDKSAVGWDSHDKLQSHESQKDYKHGFGGQFGIQKDRQDKSAVGWDTYEKVEAHESQKDYKHGFGGQFGVQKDRQDKSAVGWDSHEGLQSHESQKDYKNGFGGQFGIQKDRQDKSAVGWDTHEKVEAHESQKDYKHGFGGQFGVQKDRQDKSAVGWDSHEGLQSHESQKDYKKGFEPSKRAGGISNLKSRFEQFQMGSNSDDAKVTQERERRRLEDEALRKREKELAAVREANEHNHTNISVNVDNVTTTNFKSYKSPDVMIGSIQKVTSPHTKYQIEEAHKNGVHSNNISKSSIEEKKENIVVPSFEKKESFVPPPAPSGNVMLINSLPKKNTSDSFDQNSSNDDEWNDDNAESLITKVQPPRSTFVPSGENLIKENVYSIDPLVPETDNGVVAVALFEYEKQDEDEIGFDVDDIITNIEKVDVGWWRGTCKGQTGLFPANYVKEQ
uniref:Cortactin (inferred by orthology to a D. melanogaster protein) n=1 Tax=Strongyloides venezuelensis TaxID=75913 RepID=A0A0K0EXG6_STRVS